MSVCEYCGHCGHLYGSWHTCKGTQAAALQTSKPDALRAARSASEQSRDTAVRAEVIMLRDENARLQRELNEANDSRNHWNQQFCAADQRLDHLTAQFEASQLLADQAIKERDEWHARWEHAQNELDAQITPRYRAAFPDRTHDGIVLDKAIRPREVTG